MRHRIDHIQRAAAACLAPCLAGGCALLPTGSYSPTDAEYARPVPADLAQERTLNIQVIRDGTRLELTNTTARSFGASTLWVNRRFSRPIESFEIGQTLDLPLGRFVDQYGVPFRAGGFFATEPPDPVVLVQLEHEGELFGLIVTENRF